MKKTISLISIVLIATANCFSQNNVNFINPGLVFHTCKKEVVVQKRAKVVLIDNTGKKVYGKVVRIDQNSFIINSKANPNVAINYNDISELRLRKFGLPSAPKIKYYIYLSFSPFFGPYALTTSKRFYLNQSNLKAKKKQVVLDYTVKEIQLKGISYGKSVLCQ